MSFRPILLIVLATGLHAQLSDNCMTELFDSASGKWNVYARASNAWVTYIKETAPGPSEAARTRYAHDVERLAKEMGKRLAQLMASHCFTRSAGLLDTPSDTPSVLK